MASYGFLSILNPSGTALIYSTLLGATANIDAFTAASGTAFTKVAVDANNNIYVTGSTGDGNFMNTAAAYQTTFTGNEYETIVAKYNNVVTPPHRFRRFRLFRQARAAESEAYIPTTALNRTRSRPPRPTSACLNLARPTVRR